MNTIAIIPARGGSKRIPQKNIYPFMGKPMIAWTIEAALKSKIFDKVLVSTDCEEIAKAAISFGAEVPFLRNRYFDDISPVSLATIDALFQAETHWGKSFSKVVQLMPNCPLRNFQDIVKANDYFNEHKLSFQISCFQYGWMNPWWATRLNENLEPNKLFPEADDKRSQELEKLYCPTGAIWIADRNNLVNSGTFYGQKHIYHPMKWWSAVDIDDFDDLNMASAVSAMKNKWL